MRYFHGDLITHHSHVSLCFHAREKPLLSRPRLPPCLQCRAGAPRGRSRPRLGLPRLSWEQAPRDAGRAGRAGLPQLCRPSPALPACLFSRLGQGHKRHYRLAARSCFSRRKSHFGNQRSGCLTQPAGLQLQVCTRSQPGSASFPGSTSSFGAEGQSKSIRPASQSRPRMASLHSSAREVGTRAWHRLQPHTRLPTLKGKPKYGHTPDSTQRKQRREKLSILVSTPQPAFLEVLMSHFLEPVFGKKLSSFTARSIQMYSACLLDGKWAQIHSIKSPE